MLIFDPYNTYVSKIRQVVVSIIVLGLYFASAEGHDEWRVEPVKRVDTLVPSFLTDVTQLA